MDTVASQITSLTIVYSTVWSDAGQGKHQSFELLAFVRGIHRGQVNSPHKGPVTRKMFPFDDVIMVCKQSTYNAIWISGDHCLKQTLKTPPLHVRKSSAGGYDFCWVQCLTCVQTISLIIAERYHFVLGRVIRESIVSHMLIFSNGCLINTLFIKRIRIPKALWWNIYFCLINDTCAWI